MFIFPIIRTPYRYIKRGADELGDVANFVETEQILTQPHSNRTSSAAAVASAFVQVSVRML